MCEFCSRNVNRRQFVASGVAALGTVSLMNFAMAADDNAAVAPREKKPALVKVVFLYPRPEDCDAGKADASWQEYHWNPYPGNQYGHDKQREKFAAKITEIAARIGVQADIHPGHVNTSAQAAEYAAKTKPQSPDAVLAVCLSDACTKWSHDIIQKVGSPGIVYMPTGASHQVPEPFLTQTPGLHLIYSIENWEEIDRSLRAVHARKMIAQSRLLRVSGEGQARATDKLLGFETVEVPAAEYNGLFDSIKPDDPMNREAAAFKNAAKEVMDVTDYYLLDAFRAHKTVTTILSRYGGDAITINCLHLQQRKPCVSFSINNGNLTPCGCENDLNASLTMMLGRHLFGRAGFQHNPGYDTTRNRYFGTHCTCATRLQGPNGPSQEYLIRPFFHHLPKTAALDVQWTPGSPALLMKYAHETEPAIHAWSGKVIESPKCPPTGGCATRVLVDFGDGEDVTKKYAGAHPVMYSVDADEARCLGIYAKLYKLKLIGSAARI